jgi:hypothetical protein
MATPQETFPRTLAAIEEAILETVAEFLIGSSDEEIVAIAKAKGLDVDAVTVKVRAMIDRAWAEREQ